MCLRIGSFVPERVLKARIRKGYPRILSSWLSPRDAVQLTWRCIEAPASVRFAIYYGISNNKRAYWDTQNAREEIGYDPQDNAEELL